MVKLKDNCRDPSYLPFFPLDKSTVLKKKKIQNPMVACDLLKLYQ